VNDLKKHIVLNFINVKIVAGDLGIFMCGLRLVSVDKIIQAQGGGLT